MHFTTLLTIFLLLPATAIAVNPFHGKNFYANSAYAEKLEATISTFLSSGDVTNAKRVKTVQRTGTFTWLSAFSKLPNLPIYISEASSQQNKTGQEQIVELVIYNIPDRDCSAIAAAGELSYAQGGEAKYRKFIDQIAMDIRTKGKDLSFAIILEPDSLPNLVTNMAVKKCAAAAEGYKNGIAYAIRNLQFPNVALYIDAGHCGWLGWDNNLAPAAKLFAEVLKRAGHGMSIRGFATNVSNYNAYRAAVREKFTNGSRCWDESHYVNNLAPYLKADGLPQHFIIDVGRSGRLGIRSSWSEFCNIKDAGFGPSPTTDTDDPIVDALVWVKPGGECDGTSDPKSPRFDKACSGPNSKVPAPEGGEWFNAYAVDLIKNANPLIPPAYD